MFCQGGAMDDNKLLEVCEDIASIKADLKNIIVFVNNHIQTGIKYRLAIIGSCIAIIGTIVSGIVRFSVMEYKVIVIQANQDRIKEQIYDLNYEKGRAIGLSEGQK